MGVDRRGFLRIAGLGALGIAGVPGMRLFKPGEALASTGEGAAGGRRWAMVVDLRKGCPGDCKDCITACHTTHNVPAFADEAEPKLHEMKWIWKSTWERVLPGLEQPYLPEEKGGERPVLALCNHCDNPPCVRVCPTKATFRRADGIVTMDFHRCIGCRFCMAACPYGSRSFNWREPWPRDAQGHVHVPNPAYPTRTRGVVEKCTFCVERIEKGLQPACVEGCKEKMLAFGNLREEGSAVRELLRANFTVRRKTDLGTLPQVYYIV
jgi:molybdopterin-containing oxidoreductase family iron-sulfur binding subunit